jgi:hypothetical protein
VNTRIEGRSKPLETGQQRATHAIGMQVPAFAQPQALPANSLCCSHRNGHRSSPGRARPEGDAGRDQQAGRDDASAAATRFASPAAKNTSPLTLVELVVTVATEHRGVVELEGTCS